MRWMLSVLILAAGCSGAKTLELVSLNNESQHACIEYVDTVIVTNTGNAIVVQAGGKEEWPNVMFRAQGKPWDLRGYFRVSADITNNSNKPVHIGLRLDNPYENKEDAPQHAQGFELVEPGETRTISIRLTSEEWVFDKPLELVGMRRAPGIELMNVAEIDRVSVFTGHAHGPHSFTVSNIRAEGEVAIRPREGFLPFVDTYGQYKHDEWKLKIHSDEDLQTLRVAEEAELDRLPAPAGFGGWKKGPKLKATGAFRVEKVDGKWWMVDPDGYLFWSNGPTCIDPDFGYTGIQEREHYFENLPSEDGPLGGCYNLCGWAPHGFYADKVPFISFQFYKANLIRKYGRDWRDRWNDTVHRRLKSWGMNTVANWAARDVCLKQRTPYVANFFIRDNRPLAGSAGYWSQFHDVFDPSFRAVIRKSLRARAEEAVDPWCIGFYIDNELSWGYDGKSLALETLACPAEQPAKQEFLKDLKMKYRKIGALNAAWGTVYTSWKALAESRQTPDANRAADDLRAFYAKIADVYFKTIKEELHKAAPDRLYLGCRFAWVNDTVAIAASRYCDVVSYNKYEYSVRGMRLPEGAEDKPLMIGEYHFGATDRGHFHPGLRDSRDQQHRAENFKAYLKSALDNPKMVGVHWFQYVDEHIAGRADGENYNVGLVDVCDTPYPEMVTAIREVSAQMYEYRTGKGK